MEETPPPYHEIEEAPPGYAGEREGRGQGDDGDRGERRGRERERRVEVRRVYTYAYLRTEVDEEVSWADFGEE